MAAEVFQIDDFHHEDDGSVSDDEFEFLPEVSWFRPLSSRYFVFPRGLGMLGNRLVSSSNNEAKQLNRPIV